MPGSVNGTLQIGSEADIERISAFLEKLSTGLGFFNALFGKFDIRPSGEQVELVPLGLAMTDKH